jgi:CelD/BcsL family acetyltransferase involved in cellulose biosynthesis
MDFRIISDFEEFDNLQPQWDALVAKSKFSNIFALFGFIKAWWQAYGYDKKLRLILGQENDKICVIAPFFFKEMDTRRWFLVGDYRADYNNLIVDTRADGAVRNMIRWLCTQPGWTALQMRKIPSSSASMDFFQNAYGPSSTYIQKMKAWFNFDAPIVYRTCHKQHFYIDRKFLEANKEILSTSNYRKHINWFSRQGKLIFRTLTTTKEIHDYLPCFMDLHRKEWESKNMPSLFASLDNRNFYSFLTDEMVQYNNSIQLDIMELDNVLVSAHFGFLWDGRKYYYKPCYDPDYSSHSPGKLLLAYIIQKAAEDNSDELDLLLGEETYKEKYAPSARETVSLVVYRNRFSALQDRIM